jgi:hypothetical protein
MGMSDDSDGNYVTLIVDSGACGGRSIVNKRAESVISLLNVLHGFKLSMLKLELRPNLELIGLPALAALIPASGQHHPDYSTFFSRDSITYIHTHLHHSINSNGFRGTTPRTEGESHQFKTNHLLIITFTCTIAAAFVQETISPSELTMARR